MAFKLVCKSDSYRWLYTPFWLSKQLYTYDWLAKEGVAGPVVRLKKSKSCQKHL